MLSRTHVMGLVAGAALCAASQSASADIMYWYSHLGNNWSNAGSWYNASTSQWPNATPTAVDYVMIGDGVGFPGNVTVDAPALAGDMQVGAFNTNGNLTVRNSLTVSSTIFAGIGVGTGNINVQTPAGSLAAFNLYAGYTSGGNVTITDGSITVSSTFYVGSDSGGVGTLNVSGGTITADALHLGVAVNATGTATVSGGTITTNWLGIGAAGGTGTLTLVDTGKIIIGTKYETTDFWMTTLSGLISDGKLIDARAQVVGDTVEITVVPEPAALGLVAAGALLIRRRRHA